MTLSQLSISELQELLMDETKKLTAAIRDNEPPGQRKELRQRIQEIQKILESRQEHTSEEGIN